MEGAKGPGMKVWSKGRGLSDVRPLSFCDAARWSDGITSRSIGQR